MNATFFHQWKVAPIYSMADTVCMIYMCVCFSVSLNHKYVGQLSSWKQNVANKVAV